MRNAARLSITAFVALISGGTAHAAHELGIEVHRSSTLGPTVAADLGVKWVRIDLDWDLAQPTSGTIDFSAVDAAVDAAKAKQLSIVLVIAHTPGWASSGDTETSTHRNDVPTTGTYAAFVKQVVQRYKTLVTTYELWDEPNLISSFEGTPKQYIDSVLVPGANAVRAACPLCQVLNGGLSSAYSSSWDVWLDAILEQAQNKIDGVAGHIFAGFPEDDPKFGTTEDSFLNILEAPRVVTTAGVTFTGPRSFKDVMVENACTKNFWLTATGAEAATTDPAALARQRAYVRHVLEKVAPRTWWTRTFFYDAVDPAGPGARFGLTSDAGATYGKKPAFDLLALAATSEVFGGMTAACGDGLDNDEDGKIDFPEDTECFDPTTASEGPFSIPDLANATDGGTPTGEDAGGTGGSSGGGGGGGNYMPPTRGCTLGGRGDAVVLTSFLLVILLCARSLRRTRRP